MSNKEEILDQEELEVAAVETVEEETAAAKTIAPKGKAASMNAVMDAMSKMSGEDLNGFVAMMKQYGAGKDWGVPEGAAAKNAATLNMKPSHASAAMKEDLNLIFQGENLSEDFVEKTSTLFEAALNARLSVEKAALEEQFEERLNEEIGNFSEQVTDKVNSYLDYVVENWMKENEVAIESALRNELMEEFIGGLKNLFAEHYINVPEERVDVLEAMAEKVDALESKLDEAITENNQLKSVLVEEAAKKIFTDLASDLALTQQEKFASLAEGIEFDGDLETFAKKLTIIKESYFSNEASQNSSIEDETYEGEADVVVSDSVINRYAQAIARTVKK